MHKVSSQSLFVCRAVKELVKKYPVLLDIQNQEGWFPLHLAVLNNQCENVKTILQLVRFRFRYFFISWSGK
jgi:ankyrin repeat protein